MSAPNKLSVWWRSLRAYSLPLTLLPILCAFLYARALGEEVRWPVFPLMLLCGVLLHAGTNVLNDHYDYVLGFDTEEASGSSGLLLQKLVPENYMLAHGRFYLAAGCAAGALLIRLCGWPLLPMGAAAACGAFFYSHPHGYKYKGAGEPAVFLLMGPLLFAAAFYTACGKIYLSMFLPACGFGCLVTAVLLANNIRDEEMDRSAGFVTLPMRMPPAASRRLYLLLVAGAMLTAPLLFFSRQIGWPGLLPLLSLPMAVQLIRRVRTARQPAVDLKTGPQQTAALYMAYGVLLAAGLALGG
jgi:1,4-dihydroxy-2-naphthoate octaprenyltransferase